MNSSLRQVLGLLDIRPGRVIRSVLLGFATLACAIGLAAASAWLIARASQHPGPAALSIAAVGVRAAGVGRAVFRYLERLSSHDVALRGMASLRERVYRELAAGNLAPVWRIKRGDLLTRIGMDVDAVGDLVVRAVIPSLVAAVTSVAAVVLIAAFNVAAGLILAACLLAAGVLAPWLTALGVKGAERRLSTERAALSASFHTAMDDAGPLLVAGRTDAVLADMARAERGIWAAVDRSALFAAAGTLIGNLALGLAAVGAIWVGVPATLSGSLSPTELAVVVLTPLAAFEATSVLPMAAVQWHRSRLAAGRITALLAPGAPSTHTASPHLSLAGVTVGWEGKPVATDLSVTVHPGQLLAIVGPSGAGKTTVLATLAGLIPPLAGHAGLPGGAGVAFVGEDAHIFATTVAHNLHVAAKDIPDPGELLSQVGLGHWLAGLPQGLDTVLGSGGHTMSGGERRRLLLARALASPAPYLLLDEPTEHLDPAAADAIVADLARRAHTTGQGIVIATHRVSALTHADHIIVLGEAHGTVRIVAAGTHEQLLAHNESYRHAQFDEVEAP